MFTVREGSQQIIDGWYDEVKEPHKNLKAGVRVLVEAIDKKRTVYTVPQKKLVAKYDLTRSIEYGQYKMRYREAK